MNINEQALRDVLATDGQKEPTEYLGSVTALLSALSLYERHPDPLVRIGEGCGDARPESLAPQVIRHANEYGVEEAISAVADFNTIETVRTETYVYVENVHTDEIVDLGFDIVAMPDSCAPHQLFADSVNRAKSLLNTSRGAILRATQESSPFLRAPRKPVGPTPYHGLTLTPPGMERIEMILKMLTLSGPAFPAIRVRTTVPMTNALRLFPSGGVSFNYPGYQLTSLPKKITPDAAELGQQYEALSTSDRRRVDVAIGRLGLSVAKQQPSEAIIDLAIALEAILSDKGNKEELTYRLRIRAALFLGTSIEERKTIKEAIKALYSERSSVVHGGIPENTDHTLRRESEELIVGLIKKVLSAGAIPDWGVVELTGGSCLQWSPTGAEQA